MPPLKEFREVTPSRMVWIAARRDYESEVRELHAKIGELTV